MHTSLGVSILAGFLMTTPFLHAQSADKPLGHWEGVIKVPGVEQSVEVDLWRDQSGELAGTITMPEQRLVGLPLQKIAVDGASITLQAREDQSFRGSVSADGNSIVGELMSPAFLFPFNMIRTGEAQIATPAKIAPIAKELEGVWEGAVEVGGSQFRIVLKMSNTAAGSTSATLINLDEGSLHIPISNINQEGPHVSIGLAAVGGSFTATLSQESGELAGTYRQGTLVAPLTFHRK